VFILFVKVITEQQVSRSLLNSSLKPPFKCATGAKDLQANIIVILVFVSGGQQFLFGFGLLISDFLVFVKITSFFFSKYSLFFSALAALGMFFLLSLLFGSILYLLWLGSREGFCNGNVRGTVFLLMWSNEKCSQASFHGGNLLETCLLFPPHILYWKMLRNNSANSKQNQLKLKSENNSCRSGLWFLGWSSFSWGFLGLKSSFSSWPDSSGTDNTSTKPRDHLLFEGNGSKGSNGDWTMSVLEHHVLRFKEILGAGTIMGDFFVGLWFLWFLLSSKKGLVTT